MIRIAQIICLFIFFISESAYGDAKIIKELPSELVVEASASYVLGDNDTRIDARNIALNESKRAASELVGTHVKSELVIENDQVLRDQITVIAAAFLKVEIVKEEMTVSKDHSSILQITIRANLDKNLIRTKINLYLSDAKRQEELRRLQDENSRLQKELESLNAELSKVHSSSSGGASTQKPQTDLLARRDAVISHLENNQGQVRNIFEKGALLGLAKQNADEYYAALQVIDQQFFGYIQNNTKIKMTEPKFLDNGNGTYDVVIGISWSADPDPAEKVLGDLLHVSQVWSYPSNSYNIEVSNSQEMERQRPYTRKLYNYLVGKRVVIRVEIGKMVKDLTIAAGTDNDNGGYNFGTDHFLWAPNGVYGGVDQLGKSLQNDESRHINPVLLWSMVKSFSWNKDIEQNPVVIKAVPESMLKQLTSINAKIMIVDVSGNLK